LCEDYMYCSVNLLYVTCFEGSLFRETNKTSIIYIYKSNIRGWGVPAGVSSVKQ
jgi:hypothetical protein